MLRRARERRCLPGFGQRRFFLPGVREASRAGSGCQETASEAARAEGNARGLGWEEAAAAVGSEEEEARALLVLHGRAPEESRGGGRLAGFGEVAAAFVPQAGEREGTARPGFSRPVGSAPRPPCGERRARLLPSFPQGSAPSD